MFQKYVQMKKWPLTKKEFISWLESLPPDAVVTSCEVSIPKKAKSKSNPEGIGCVKE